MTIVQNGSAAYAVSNEGRIAGRAEPVEVVVWNPYEEKSPGDLPPPAFKVGFYIYWRARQEFVCVEPGLIGQMKEEFVEMHVACLGWGLFIFQRNWRPVPMRPLLRRSSLCE